MRNKRVYAPLKSEDGCKASLVAQFEEFLGNGRYLRIYVYCCVPLTLFKRKYASGVVGLLQIFDADFQNHLPADSTISDSADTATSGISLGSGTTIFVELRGIMLKYVFY